MVGLGGPTAGGDDALKALYDLDELKHKYHVIRKMNPAQAKEFRRKLREKNATKLYIPVSQKVVFKTVGRGPRRRVIAMRRKMNCTPQRHGRRYAHRVRNSAVPKWFGDNSIIAKNEWREGGHK